MSSLILLPFAGAAIVAFLGAALFTPWVFASLMVVAQTLLGGAERGAFLGPIRLGELGLLAATAGAVLSPRWRFNNLRRCWLNQYVVLYVLTCAVLPLLRWVITGHGVGLDAIQAYGGAIKGGLVYASVGGLGLNARESRQVLLVIMFAVVLSACVAILQWVDYGPVWRILLTYYKSPHLYMNVQGQYDRATGLLANWHGLSVSYAMAMVLGLNLVRGERHLALRRLLVVSLGLVAVGLLATQTFVAFGSLLGVGLFLLWQSLRRRRYRLRVWHALAPLGVVVGAAATLPILFPERYTFGGLVPASGYFRLYQWFFLLGPVIREHWLLGYGPFLPAVQVAPGARLVLSDDSQVISLLLRGGVVALTGWLLLVAATTRHLTLLRLRISTKSAVLDTAFGSTLILAAASLLQSFFNYTGVLEFYWVLLAMSRPELARDQSDSGESIAGPSAAPPPAATPVLAT